MSVYNTEKYLHQAIDSILSQTFSDFDFLIFNDGSTDSSVDIIRSYTDKRIKFFDSVKNLGPASCSNRGLDIAKGEYIARMDSDDISAPNRLEKQVSFMDKNPDVGLCGAWYDIIGEPEHIVKLLATDKMIRLRLFTDNAMAHSAAMLRSSVLQTNKLRYDVNFRVGEDYFLWVVLSKHCKLANIREVLMHYRKHKDQLSTRERDKGLYFAQVIRNYQAELLLNRPLSDDEKKIHSLLFQYGELDSASLKLIEAWIEQLLTANQQRRLYPKSEFSYLLKRRLYNRTFIRAKHYHLSLLMDFWFSHGRPFLYFSNKERLFFTTRTLSTVLTPRKIKSYMTKMMWRKD